jgi:hypothetical protein
MAARLNCQILTLSFATPSNVPTASIPAAGRPYCIVCTSDLRMLKFAEICGIKSMMPKKKNGFGGVAAWDGSDAHHARCQICEHAQPQVQPLHATGRHPGDVLTKFQPFSTTRESAKAKKLFISHGFGYETLGDTSLFSMGLGVWVRNNTYSTHVPMGSRVRIVVYTHIAMGNSTLLPTA